MTCWFHERERAGLCDIVTLTENNIDSMNHRYQEEFEQTSTILLKVVERASTKVLGRAMARLNTQTTRFDVIATIEWGASALCSAVDSTVGAAAGTGWQQLLTVDGWLWAAVGLLLAVILGQTGYTYRGPVGRALQSASDRLRRRPPPPPPIRPPPILPPPPPPLANTSAPPYMPPLLSSPCASTYSPPSVEDTLPPLLRRLRSSYSTPPLSPASDCGV
uniref:Uncharacterized protein n=1 Tax=Plectus sambesii TaxID=2011161 RepID=A0A914XM59_9BILA